MRTSLPGTKKGLPPFITMESHPVPKGSVPTMKDATVRRLQALEEEYTFAVNAAVGENRDDLVEQLANEYPDAALEVLRSDAA
jgi:hypothetical protein